MHPPNIVSIRKLLSCLRKFALYMLCHPPLKFHNAAAYFVSANAMAQNDLIDILPLAIEIDQATSIGEVHTALLGAVSQFGYSACLITNLTMMKRPRWHENIMANDWPDDWYNHYNAAGHYQYDPCVARSLRSAEPFTWREIDTRSLSPAAVRVMGEAKEFGLREGICIPVHVPFSAPAVISLSGRKVAKSDLTRPTVTILARQALSSALRIMSHSAPRPTAALTQREKEILRWVAEGKTAWEISRILSLSEHTVLTHQRNAKNKLGAANNVHAVVTAFLKQEIQP